MDLRHKVLTWWKHGCRWIAWLHNLRLFLPWLEAKMQANEKAFFVHHSHWLLKRRKLLAQYLRGIWIALLGCKLWETNDIRSISPQGWNLADMDSYTWMASKMNNALDNFSFAIILFLENILWFGYSLKSKGPRNLARMCWWNRYQCSG